MITLSICNINFTGDYHFVFLLKVLLGPFQSWKKARQTRVSNVMVCSSSSKSPFSGTNRIWTHIPAPFRIILCSSTAALLYYTWKNKFLIHCSNIFFKLKIDLELDTILNNDVKLSFECCVAVSFLPIVVVVFLKVSARVW